MSEEKPPSRRNSVRLGDDGQPVSLFDPLEQLVSDLNETLKSLKSLESMTTNCSTEEEHLRYAELWSENQKRVQRHLHYVQPALVQAAAACAAAEHTCHMEGDHDEIEAMEEAVNMVRKRSLSFVRDGWSEPNHDPHSEESEGGTSPSMRLRKGPLDRDLIGQILAEERTKQEEEKRAKAAAAAEEDKTAPSSTSAPAAADGDDDPNCESEGEDEFAVQEYSPAPPATELCLSIHGDRCHQIISADGCHVDIQCSCSPLFADVMDYNARAALGYKLTVPTGIARIGLAVVTCIDSRIDPLKMFGLKSGDAKFLRNAGARVTLDVERSLAAATAVLGVTRIAVVAHTKCKMASVSQDDVVSAVIACGGDPCAAASFDYMTTADQDQTLREDVMRLRNCTALRPGTIVAAFMLDMDTGLLRVVDNGEWVPPSLEKCDGVSERGE